MASESGAEAAASKAIPGASAITSIIVCKDVPASLPWYRDIMGAEVYREYGTTIVLKWLEAWFLLVEEGGPTPDKPSVTLKPPTDPDTRDVLWTIRVEDAQAAHDELVRRGATFLTPPIRNGSELRCFTRDPSGHLFELSSISS